MLDNCGCGELVDVFVQCLKAEVQGIPPTPVPGCTASWSGKMACQPACPEINWLIDTPDPKCNPDGTRNVSNLGAVVANPALPLIEAQLEWVEGNVILDGPKQGVGQVSLGPVTHAFPSGTQTLHVTVKKPPSCGGSKHPILVDPCGPVGACCLPVLGVPNASACEEMTKAECDAKGGVYQGDGTMCDQVDCGPPKKNDGSGNGGGPSACGALTYVVAFLLAITLCTLILIGTLYCMGIPVPPLVLGIEAGLAIATVAVIVLWKSLCGAKVCPCPTGCDWLNIAWMACLAGAVFALYVSSCCPAMLVVSVGLFALALLLWGGWVAQCKPDTCSVLKSLLLALGSGAALMIAYSIVIPAILVCGLVPVGVVVASLVALLIIAVNAC